MTRAMYKGPLDQIVNLNIRFKKGVMREVPDNVLDKLQGHKEFEVEGRPYKLDPSAVGGKLILEDEAEVLEDENAREYDIDQLSTALLKRKVKIPKAAANDANALMELCLANGGVPTDEELGE